MKVLITGGTGTVGGILTRQLLTDDSIESVRVLGRSEYRTLLFKQSFRDDPRVDVASGDVADARSMELNSHGMDVVYHLAAMKHVDLVEKDPYLAMQTNIEGTKNVVEAAIRTGVSRVVVMSTDKVVHASSLYGATKLIAEKVALSANAVKPMFNVIRSGNVLKSSGSVFEVWARQVAERNVIDVTDPTMTRFIIEKTRLAQDVAAMKDQPAGIVYVPKSPAFRLQDIAEMFIEMSGRAGTKMRVIGNRPGEKQHEELVSVEELARTHDHDDHYIVGTSPVEKPLAHVPSSADHVTDIAVLKRFLEADGDA